MGTAHSIFTSTFGGSTNTRGKMSESIMDFSKSETLCTDIWDVVDGKFTLKSDVLEKLISMADWAIEKFGLSNTKVRLIGSICSNAYDDDSDLDIHITDTSLSKERRDEINVSLSKMFKAEFEDEDRDLVNGHPVEIYIQENEYRDLMSVGCYNLNSGEWEVGPTIYPMNYDPYTEYYAKIYMTNNGLIKRIRDYIMSLREYSYTKGLSERSSDEFKEILKSLESDIVGTAAVLLDEARNMRGALTEPSSREEALETKELDDWKISDATFKLLGKFGYISILKKVSKMDANSELGIFVEELNDTIGNKLFIERNASNNGTDSVQD